MINRMYNNLYHALNLVVPAHPKVQEIKVKPSNNLIESNSNFSIICNIFGDSSTEIEFLFRQRRSNETILIGKVWSNIEENFIWTSNLLRKLSRNSSGDYFCRDLNDHRNIANISIDINCMNISNANY